MDPLRKTASVRCAGAVALFMTFYGVRTMDHYSLRRVEFKKAALWFNEHAGPADTMLIAEVNVPGYYSRLEGRRYIGSNALKSADIARSSSSFGSGRSPMFSWTTSTSAAWHTAIKMRLTGRPRFLKKSGINAALARHFMPVARFETRGGITARSIALYRKRHGYYRGTIRLWRMKLMRNQAKSRKNWWWSYRPSRGGEDRGDDQGAPGREALDEESGDSTTTCTSSMTAPRTAPASSP